MMAMLFRLRRGLAHLICPELGVEARLKVARENLTNGLRLPADKSERWKAAVSHALTADDAFVALGEVIGALRRENALMGLADREFAARLCGLLVQADVTTAPPAGASK